MWTFLTWKHETIKNVWWGTLILEGETAVSRNLHLLVDAEYSYVNPGSSLIALAMMAVFNQNRPVVANTYQCYFKVTSLLLWLTLSWYLYLYFPLSIHSSNNLMHRIPVYERCQISLTSWIVCKFYRCGQPHEKPVCVLSTVWVCAHVHAHVQG